MRFLHGLPSLGLTLTVGLLGAGCGRHSETDTGRAAGAPPLPAVTVRIEAVRSETVTATEDVVGTVRPTVSAKISARIPGTISRLLVAPGQEVKAGELLAELEAREIQAQLEQAAAMRDQADKDLERFKKLLPEQIVTQQEFDNVQARAKVARAKVSEAETMLGYMKIAAPFAGVITARHAQAGDLASPGQPLLEMEDSRALRLEAFVPEATAGSLKLGAEFAVVIDAVNATLKGRIGELSPTADVTSRTFLVKFDLPSLPGVRGGQFGRVQIPVATSRTLCVPESALVTRGQMEMVFVVDGSRHARMRLVKTGRRNGGKIELLSGVTEQDKVAVTGAEAMKDGQPVVVQP
jgi:RND family efflux transporter MFP subunit